MKINIDEIVVDGEWLHGTYNSTLWISKDRDGNATYDIYHKNDRELLGLGVDRPKKISIDGSLVVHFYHGRKSVDEELNDWGSDGPVINVLGIVLDETGIELKVTEQFTARIDYVGDLLPVMGMFYGDIDISVRTN